MAYTIKSQPTTPNCTYTSLIYNVSSSNASEPQFNYLMDVYLSGSSDRLARIRQFPNPVLEAVFDPSRILNDNLGYTLNFTTTAQLTNNNVRTFSIEFGEEYGTSSSSSLAVTSSISTALLEVFPCSIDPNNGTSFNYLDSASAVILSDRANGINEYEGVRERISVYNGTGGSEDVTINYSLGGSTTQAVPAGEFYLISFPFAAPSSGSVTVSFGNDSFTKNYQPKCHYPTYNFHFINKYGVWENFSTNLPVRGNVDLDRQNYEQTFVNYASTGTYDITRRGENNYSTGITENLTISTDWLSQTQAEWMTQMIESDEIYLAVSPTTTTFKPIVITNASYVQNTGRKDQKTFMYDITFRYANQRLGR